MPCCSCMYVCVTMCCQVGRSLSPLAAAFGADRFLIRPLPARLQTQPLARANIVLDLGAPLNAKIAEPHHLAHPRMLCDAQLLAIVTALDLL